MFIDDLACERNILRFTQKHHLKSLYTPDNPSGILLCQKHWKGFHWKIRDLENDCPKTTSIRKTEKQLAEDLAVNLYRLVCLQYLENEIASIDSVIRNHNSADPLLLASANSESARTNYLSEVDLDKLLYRVRNYPRVPADFFAAESPYRPFILSRLKREYSWIIDWYLADFVRNTDFPEYLLFKVKLGFNVRSKSEVIIADRLYEKGILYHYDEQLLLPDDVAYLDFTIPLSLTEKFGWEHFGAMDSPKYHSRARSKILSYLENNLYPGLNMITTYETRQHPLSLEQVDQKIRWLKNRHRLAFPDLPPDDSFNLYDLVAHVEQCRKN